MMLTVRDLAVSRGGVPVLEGVSFDLGPGRALVLASGTPITNTLGEMFSVQRFLGIEALKERGLHEFDAWASTFGRAAGMRPSGGFTTSDVRWSESVTPSSNQTRTEYPSFAPAGASSFADSFAARRSLRSCSQAAASSAVSESFPDNSSGRSIGVSVDTS